MKSQEVSKATSKGVWTHCELKQVMRLLRQPDETHPNQKLLMPCAELGVFRCFSAISGWINHTWISFSYRSQNLQKETSFFLLYYFFFNLKNKILKIKTYAEVQKYQTKELNHHLSFKTTFFLPVMNWDMRKFWSDIFDPQLAYCWKIPLSNKYVNTRLNKKLCNWFKRILRSE